MQWSPWYSGVSGAIAYRVAAAVLAAVLLLNMNLEQLSSKAAACTKLPLSAITSWTCSNFWNLACQGSHKIHFGPKMKYFLPCNFKKKKILGEGEGGGWAMPPDPPYVLHVYTCDFSCTTFTQLAMALVSEYFIVQDLIVYCPSLHTTHTCAYAYHRLLPLCTVRSRCKV